jgi:hypothetical protein
VWVVALSHVEISVWEGHAPNILRAVTAHLVGLDKLSGDVRSTIHFTLYHVAVSQVHSRPAQHDRSLYSFGVCRTVHRRLRSKCDGTRTETRFRLLAKRTSTFKSAGGGVIIHFWQASCAHQPAGFVLLVQACVL